MWPVVSRAGFENDEPHLRFDCNRHVNGSKIRCCDFRIQSLPQELSSMKPVHAAPSETSLYLGQQPATTSTDAKAHLE